jgi:hypothetical protein
MKQCKRREEFTNWKDDIKIDFGKWVVSQVTAPGSCFTSDVLLASLNFRVLLGVLYVAVMLAASLFRTGVAK